MEPNTQDYENAYQTEKEWKILERNNKKEVAQNKRKTKNEQACRA
jgi:hypothetical protein